MAFSAFDFDVVTSPEPAPSRDARPDATQAPRPDPASAPAREPRGGAESAPPR